MPCLPTDQISVRTGIPYIETFAATLRTHNFPSNYWLTAHCAKLLGISLTTDCGLKTHCGTLYNASQTTDPSKAALHAGRIQPVWAVTAMHIQTSACILTQTGQNAWLTNHEIEALGLFTKPNAKAMNIQKETVDFLDDKPIKCFALESICESEKVEKVLSARHTLASKSAHNVSRSNALLLYRMMLTKGYTDALWIANDFLEKKDLEIKLNESAVKIVSKFHPPLDLYNIDQFVDKARCMFFIRQRYELQISGLFGKVLPLDISDYLMKIVMQNPSYSRYWLTSRQAKSLKVVLPKTRMVQIVHEGKSNAFYNVSDLDPSVMDICVKVCERRERKTVLSRNDVFSIF